MSLVNVSYSLSGEGWEPAFGCFCTNATMPITVTLQDAEDGMLLRTLTDEQARHLHQFLGMMLEIRQELWTPDEEPPHE